MYEIVIFLIMLLFICSIACIVCIAILASDINKNGTMKNYGGTMKLLNQ